MKYKVYLVKFFNVEVEVKKYIEMCIMFSFFSYKMDYYVFVLIIKKKKNECVKIFF